jgi:large subunit ribosomal protein L4
MASVAVKNASGAAAGNVELPDTIFGIEPNVAVMHQVVTAQLAAKRAGTHSVKTRAEVRGGGAKPWRQKGTGRARQGSIRAPQWRGGGVAHGPQPRSYAQKTPKKMKALALRSALSDRTADGKVMVVDDWNLSAPSTKAGIKLLESLGLRTSGEREDRVLVVLFRTEENAWKSLRNLGARVQIILPEELNAYDVLVNDWIVFSRGSLEAAITRFAAGEAVADVAVAAVDDTAEDTADDVPAGATDDTSASATDDVSSDEEQS